MKFQLFIYFLLASLLVLPLVSTTINAEQVVLVQYSPELKKSLQAIKRLKEGNKLICDVLKQGGLCLSVAKNTHSRKFGACWDSEKRTIFIDLSRHPSEDEIVGSLIFELHNALKAPQFNYLYSLAAKGKIEKEKYVKKVELLEYQNSIDTAALIKRGIENKVFNKKAQIPVYDTFDEHYRYQKMCGHSSVHAKSYDKLTAYNKLGSYHQF